MKRLDILIHQRILVRYHPSAFLLMAQLLTLVAYAFFDGISGGRAVLGSFGVLVLMLAVWVVNRSPAVRWIAWVLAAPAFLLSLLSALFHSQTLLVLSSLVDASLYFYAAGSLIAYMMEDYRVTTDELFAAGATFTLIAWGFGYVYLVCQIWAPESFTGAARVGEARTFLELLFLSFTTLSGVGLGDILPMTPMSRVLIMFEQLAGVAYVAMVVSRLVGMTILRGGEESAEPSRKKRSSRPTIRGKNRREPEGF